jgi:hypothetical protein
VLPSDLPCQNNIYRGFAAFRTNHRFEKLVNGIFAKRRKLRIVRDILALIHTTSTNSSVSII